MVKPRWQIADLLDLHWFFRADEALRDRGDEETAARRDRVLYLTKIEPELAGATEVPPRVLARRWLTVRRLQHSREQGETETALPGAVWRELFALGTVLAMVFGLLSGVGLAAPFLLYAGTRPINVSGYIGVFVLAQMALIVLQLLLFSYRWLRGRRLEQSVLYGLAGRLLMRAIDGLRNLAFRRMSGRQRLDFAALLGGLRQHRETAPLLVWPAFLLVQLAGVGFNLGVLGTTLSRVVFADVAFGWQSTLQLSAETVAGLVRWMALPWSWALPDAVAYPGLAQVEGSQMILKEGIRHLATGDLVSWWPFLCLCVFFYGLLPRLLLFAAGLVQQRRALDRLSFAGRETARLVRRMLTPRVDTVGRRGPGEATASAWPLPAASEEMASVSVAPAPQATGAEAVVLVPDEIYDDCPLEELGALVSRRTGLARLRPHRFGVPGDPDAEGLAALAAVVDGPGLSAVLLLQEAWQPPLQETAALLDRLRRAAGETAPMFILLIGRPAGDTIFTPVVPEQLTVWRKKMEAVGDPGLEVLPLVVS